MKLLLALSLSGLAACAQTTPTTPVDCVAYINYLSGRNHHAIHVTEARFTEVGPLLFIGHSNPFTDGRQWVSPDRFDGVICK